MKNKKISNSRIIMIILMLLVVIIGGTFAWFTYQSNKSALVLSIGDLNDSRVTIKPYQIRDTMMPVNVYTSGVYSQVDVVNENSQGMSMTLFYKINNLSSDLIDNGLKYTIVSSDTEDGTYEEVLTGDFTTLGSDTEIVIFDTTINGTINKYYRVYLWFDSSIGDQSSVANSVLDVELNARISRNRDAISYLFNQGEDATDVTGGWNVEGWSYHTWVSNSYSGAGVGDTYLYADVSGNAYAFGAIGTTNKIDLTDYNTLHIYVDKVSGGGGVFVSQTTSIWDYAAQYYHHPAGASYSGEASIDVSSLSGEYYITVVAVGSSTVTYPSITVSQLYLE